MGYSAEKVSGDSIVIKKSKATEFVNLLREGEKRFGHETVVIAIMADYGFIQDRDDNSLHLIGWGGDKIGSSWDDVWNILAQVVDSDVLWVMVGEDQQVWAERLSGGKRETLSVDFNQLVK